MARDVNKLIPFLLDCQTAMHISLLILSKNLLLGFVLFFSDLCLVGFSR